MISLPTGVWGGGMDSRHNFAEWPNARVGGGDLGPSQRPVLTLREARTVSKITGCVKELTPAVVVRTASPPFG